MSDIDQSPCPRCGKWIDNPDGMPILAHLAPDPDACGYCSHPSMDGDGRGNLVCGLCGHVDADDQVNALRAQIDAAVDERLHWQGIAEQYQEIEERNIGGSETWEPDPERFGKWLDSQAEEAEKFVDEHEAVTKERDELRRALEFYADPDSWVGVVLMADPPCGDIAKDTSEATTSCGSLTRAFPGKVARQALAARADERAKTEREIARYLDNNGHWTPAARVRKGNYRKVDGDE